MNINYGDCAFLLLSTAFVFLMTPGLAFFYAGMVRKKNVLNTMMSCFFLCGLASVLWIILGYSLSFGSDHFGIIGSLDHLFLRGVTSAPNPLYAQTVPETAFAAFQMMFAILTPALICGAVAERMKFSKLVLFLFLWSLFVYYPLAHMVWGDGGLLRSLGSLDFAGGNVVHISSGITGLIACLILGKRRGYGVLSYQPHNIPFVVLGASLLWFGWFGFNAGSALSAGELAVHAFLTTHTSAATAMLSWMIVEMIAYGKTTIMGAATGAVLGLVAITPGAGYVPLWSALMIGALVSPICLFFLAVVKKRFGYDDALDAFGCHGIGGIWGGIATGLFAHKSINPSVQWNGLLYGETHLFLIQLLSILITLVLSAGISFLILKLLSAFGPLHVSEEAEALGLDRSEHNEIAYPSFTGLD